MFINAYKQFNPVYIYSLYKKIYMINIIKNIVRPSEAIKEIEEQ
jgi:hypothetical protein